MGVVYIIKKHLTVVYIYTIIYNNRRKIILQENGYDKYG